MSGGFLLIRHAKASGQAPDAPLTAEGEEQAQKLTQQLSQHAVSRIVSSPWVRAVDTARPLAQALGLEIETDERLTERVLSGRDLPHWQTALKASFLDPKLCLEGGESGGIAKARALAALNDAHNPHGLTAIFTHGNLLALLLGLDYGGWADLRNPDVWRWAEGLAERVRLEP
ncbi:histidine phosphatase family protein [Deinococcus sp. AJ005]|uniref:histidine phosphatase family protein n=1 Tax=Deinococcus sp. AJ005 TaxID=2652443 RepID=UPI00125CB0FF|nr:histidine phosphatase family protein [Deinococcus sp. AJ005]QFP76619.1 histidine phosphatase family protein [Deinococcus sp. AJ005]